jgi:hypothetical protein
MTTLPVGSRVRRRAMAGVAALSILALAGCGEGLTNTLGLTRDAPDEFTVTTRAPLAMPDQFSLPPPQPGAPRPQERSETRQAEEALVPQAALGTVAATDSAGQEALVRKAGPAAPPDIRARVNAEVGQDQPSRPITDRLLFWQDPPPPGTVVDPQKEAQRLRANAALGTSVENGDTPIVQPKRRSILGDLNLF